MKVLYGVAGAILGAIVGGTSALLITSLQSKGNAIEDGLTFLGYGLLGLLLGVIAGVILALRLFHALREGKLSRKRKALLLAASLISPLALTAGIFKAAAYVSAPPSDRELLAHFDRHRATFDQLARMTQADKGLERVDDNWTSPDAPLTGSVSASRLAAYRRLLRNAGVPRGFRATADGTEVDFYYWLTGSAISSDTDKGYAYLTKPPPHVLSSLDPCHPDDPDEQVTAYRYIQGHWYLFYEYLPG